ncbi:MAG: amidohydrolase [Rhizobiaceae bacterium]|nr:amidohydrolase [Rhizobiaceae bacterium]
MQDTSSILADMRAWRRDFHAHPELGFEEHRTSARVAELLTEFGLDVHTGVGQTGVVGILQRGNGTTAIGLRADMDALPFEEQNSFAYRSTNSGVMHACGHDGHTAMLLGAAKHLSQSGDFNGRVIFIFQPAEEHGQGGPAMIEDGLFDRFPIDEVYGMHNMPGLPVGHFKTRRGTIMASEAIFEIAIEAKGGHAAMPHMGVDAITVGAQMVGALQTIVSRKLNPGNNGVVSVTEFITDGARNRLPGSAALSGDARALSPDVNQRIEETMRSIVAGIAQAHGVAASVAYDTIFKATINSTGPTMKAIEAAELLAGSNNVNGNCEPVLASEDFAHMAAARPGCFIFTGNGIEGANAQPLHATDYDFNDDALVPGSSFWVQLVEHVLRS